MLACMRFGLRIADCGLRIADCELATTEVPKGRLIL